jgi:hypothetical protein
MAQGECKYVGRFIECVGGQRCILQHNRAFRIWQDLATFSPVPERTTNPSCGNVAL